MVSRPGASPGIFRKTVALESRIYSLYQKALGKKKLICVKCEKELRAGDEIRRLGRLRENKNCKLYHISCFEGLYFE